MIPIVPLGLSTIMGEIPLVPLGRQTMPLSRDILNCQNKGKDMILYYNVNTCEAPVFVEHEGVIGDLNLGMTDDEEELTRRSSTSNMKEYLPGKTDISVTGTQITDGNYEGNAALNSAIADGDPIDVLVLTNDIDTVYSYGVRGKMYNFDRSINGPATGEMEQSFNLKPAACADCPVRYVKVAEAGTAADWDPTDYSPVFTS